MTENAIADETPIDWREFLADHPPGSRTPIDRAASKHPAINNSITVRCPELRLFCDGECQAVTPCRGQVTAQGRLFGSTNGYHPYYPPPPSGPNTLPYDVVMTFHCEDCQRVVKSYSLRFYSLAPTPDVFGLADVQKLAEWPLFEPRLPPKLMTLIRNERELFLKGRRSEFSGLGIGAFGYYRRIIETLKNRLLDEIIRVARHTNAPADTVETLEEAKSETQFSRAVDNVKDAIPPALFIKGHNPLTLLHSALSQGLHGHSDETCLRAATDIRLILIAFSERLSDALLEQKELNEALGRLVKRLNNSD